MKRVLVTGSFDDFRSRHARLLHEAHRHGPVRVLLWSDRTVAAVTGRAPGLPEAERLYLVQGNRYVADVIVADDVDAGPDRPPALPESLLEGPGFDVWLDTEAGRVLDVAALAGFPEHDTPARPTRESRKRTVVATGCFDWFHSGHVRFFEEASGYGELYVIVGNDANVRLLKGKGHPLFPEAERRYLVGSVRYVSGALVSSGSGWLDAEPEILALQPDLYLVNEDGDKPEKRAFCREHGLEYLVLKRMPKPGLARRSSTDLRGF